jgi:hypothetical protein
LLAQSSDIKHRMNRFYVAMQCWTPPTSTARLPAPSLAPLPNLQEKSRLAARAPSSYIHLVSAHGSGNLGSMFGESHGF